MKKSRREADLLGSCVGRRVKVVKGTDVLSGRVVQTRREDNRSLCYYVHYVGSDKRMDEWVSEDRIRTISEVVDDYDATTPPTSDDEAVVESAGVVRKRRVTVEERETEPSRVKHINTVQLGIYEIDTWYYSPYPGEYGRLPKLFICEFCLKYMKLEKSYRYHLGECTYRHPPGRLLQQTGSLSIYETDAAVNLLYCQNLCLLAKLFIDHKTVFFDIERFLFYILCEVDKQGSHVVGYFSKEKGSPDGNNVACILTLPPFQRRGYGKHLIAFSYELSKQEGVAGSPEKPLSDLGWLCYRSYWTRVLLDILKDARGCISVHELSKMTGITSTDIIGTLESLDLLKYWCGDVVNMTPDLLHRLLLDIMQLRRKT
uniref:Histone acetyltransferase n=1 Tax=Lygus hesperus TaxID=30085 RepID=A0A0A9WQD3_LYGHE